MELTSLIERIDPDRLRDLTLNLVEIASPTGDSVAVTEFYAGYLREIGLDVAIRYDVADRFPNSPSIVARLAGEPGPTMQFDGHLDTIPAEHAPPYYQDGVVHGRGAADMKCGLAAMAEVARVVRESGVPLQGGLLLTAHGLHEAPTGRGEGLSALVADGIHGDMAIVAEGQNVPNLAIIGFGQSTFEILIERQGEIVHELHATPDTPHPILVGHELVKRLRAEDAELAQTSIPLLGPETIFIGLFQSGDFYNRLPTSCRIMGTRRYGPEKTHEEVGRELHAMVSAVAEESGCRITLDFRKTREGFRMPEGDLARRVIQAAHMDVTGEPMVEVGQRSVADGSILRREAGIPAGYLGIGHGAHSSDESVRVDDIVHLTKLLLAALYHYPGFAA
jgi:acetylornithine deacetylase/succinyl-diaminopimelate desuccinylase-like protein